MNQSHTPSERETKLVMENIYCYLLHLSLLEAVNDRVLAEVGVDGDHGKALLEGSIHTQQPFSP